MDMKQGCSRVNHFLMFLFTFTVCHLPVHSQNPRQSHLSDRSVLSKASRSLSPLYSNMLSRDAGLLPSSSHRWRQTDDYVSYVYTFKELYLFSYFDDTEIVVADETERILWQGSLTEDSVQFLDLGEGVYRISGTKKYAVLIGDPVYDSTVGYFALDENSCPLSTKLLTFNPYSNMERWGDRAYFILWSYQDNTDVILRDLDTGDIIWSGTLNEGEYRAFQEETSERFLKVEATQPVAAQSYVDTGYFVPASNNTFTGRLFYVYSGGLEFEGDLHGEDIQVIAYHDDTNAEIRELSGNPVWAGTLDEGDIHNEANVYKKYLRVTSDKDISVCSMPYSQGNDTYHHLMLAQDIQGDGIGKLFFVPCIMGNLNFLVYEDDTHIVVTKMNDMRVMMNRMLDAFEYAMLPTMFDVYRVESDKSISVVESSGIRAGAEFVPLYYNVSASIYPYAQSPVDAGKEFWVDIHVGDEALAVSRLYGVSFLISWEDDDVMNDWVEHNTPDPTTPALEAGDFLGTSNDVRVEGWWHHYPDTIAAAVTRISTDETASGTGVIMRIPFRSSGQTPDSTAVIFNISDVTANDDQWNPIRLIPDDFELIILHKQGIRPNPFTPNGDGYNDFVEFNLTELRRDGGTITIYNLWGKKVRQIENAMVWYGRDDDGHVLPPGSYLYIVESRGKTVAKGVLGLAR